MPAALASPVFLVGGLLCKVVVEFRGRTMDHMREFTRVIGAVIGVVVVLAVLLKFFGVW